MADGRRSEPRSDAELLRSVFVILSGVLVFVIGVLLLLKLRRIVALVVIAAFFAIILNPIVDLVTRARIRRGLATTCQRRVPSSSCTELWRTPRRTASGVRNGESAIVASAIASKDS